MIITLKEIAVRDLVNGYEDNSNTNGGVLGFGKLLDIRPPYQREFIYKEKQREGVLTTIKNDFPLNVMYWSVRDNGTFEIIDGQQRTISICQYIMGDFSIDGKYFHNLQNNEKDQILNYKLMVYMCEGTDSERLNWFRVINISGEKLTDQELRNAVYSGTWLTDVKRYFSRTQGPVQQLGSDYLTGSSIRQDYLETTLNWISEGHIEKYMGLNQHEPNGNEIWLYFQSVINWVKVVFPKYRKEMKGIQWGFLYNKFKSKQFNSTVLEDEVTKLMMDDDVTNKKGIYEYVLTRNDKHLSIRTFTESQKREVYERQGGICPVCKQTFSIEEMEGDHITPWSKGGKTNINNCQMLCKEDNRRKSSI
jgi:hypothetical protein